MSTFKNLLQNPLIRNGLTVICVGIVIYLVYREYNKMMDRLEIIANELYKAKQEIVMLKHNMKTQNRLKQKTTTTSIDKKNKSPLSKKEPFTSQMPIIYKKTQMETKKNDTKINLPILNPIQQNNKSSIQRIAKHLPIKVELENDKIITENYLFDNELDIDEEIAYNSDSDILTSDDELLDTDDEQFNDDLSDDEELDNILSDSSDIKEIEKKKIPNETQNIENQMNNLNKELENELNDVDLDTELNTKSINNNEKMNETEELIENKKALKEEIEKLSSILEQDENKKIFGINTTIIKPEQKPKKKRKSRKGIKTAWSVFLQDKTIEKNLLTQYPDANFGILSKLKSQIWKKYTPEQKEVYKQKAIEITILNRNS